MTHLLHHNRSSSLLHLHILCKLYDYMHNFALHGNEPHVVYLRNNPQRVYAPTAESSIRSSVDNVYEAMTVEESTRRRNKLLNSSQQCVSRPCSCENPMTNVRMFRLLSGATAITITNNNSTALITPASSSPVTTAAALIAQLEYPFKQTVHLLKDMWPGQYPPATTLITTTATAAD